MRTAKDKQAQAQGHVIGLHGFYPRVLIDVKDLVVSETEAQEHELAHKDGERRLAIAKRSASYWRKMNLEPGAKKGLDHLRALTSVALVIRDQEEGEITEQTLWRQRWQYEWCTHYFRSICAQPHGLVTGESSPHAKQILPKATIVLSRDFNFLVRTNTHGVASLLCDEIGWTGIVDHLERVFAPEGWR